MVKKIMSKVIKVSLLFGCGKGEDTFISRIALTLPGREIPVLFHRLQFFLEASYVISI